MASAVLDCANSRLLQRTGSPPCVAELPSVTCHSPDSVLLSSGHQTNLFAMGRQAQAMAQAQAEITSTESLELVRCLLRVSINQVAYMRGLFGEKSFKCVDMANLDGMQIQMLLPKDAETKRLVDWVELGVTDALRQKYLKTLYFGISTDAEGTSLLEEYIFSFKYDADGRVTLDINQGKDKAFTTTSQICQTLDNVPTERYIFMRLAYNDSTPEEYEPPYFRSHKQQNASHFVRKPFSMHVGDVLTNHHAVSLKAEPEDVPESNQKTPANLPDTTAALLVPETAKKSKEAAINAEAKKVMVPTKKAITDPKKRLQEDMMALMTEPQDDIEIDCDNGDEEGKGADDAQIQALKSWCFNFSTVEYVDVLAMFSSQSEKALDRAFAALVSSAPDKASEARCSSKKRAAVIDRASEQGGVQTFGSTRSFSNALAASQAGLKHTAATADRAASQQQQPAFFGSQESDMGRARKKKQSMVLEPIHQRKRRCTTTRAAARATAGGSRLRSMKQ
ncbi:hypothetical protein WJX72_004997 [[Myrmecia] bisecta]|uniref:HORMA domain-containing protein n=1 Tax=[Myrmecia] bisecta TaxID=41462 RepID=A0AAW1PSS2_9CHLO